AQLAAPPLRRAGSRGPPECRRRPSPPRLPGDGPDHARVPAVDSGDPADRILRDAAVRGVGAVLESAAGDPELQSEDATRVRGRRAAMTPSRADRSPRSAAESALLQEAACSLAGGLVGNLRLPDELAFVVDHGNGPRLYDRSDREYIDYLLGSGP